MNATIKSSRLKWIKLKYFLIFPPVAIDLICSVHFFYPLLRKVNAHFPARFAPINFPAHRFD